MQKVSRIIEQVESLFLDFAIILNEFLKVGLCLFLKCVLKWDPLMFAMIHEFINCKAILYF